MSDKSPDGVTLPSERGLSEALNKSLNGENLNPSDSPPLDDCRVASARSTAGVSGHISVVDRPSSGDCKAVSDSSKTYVSIATTMAFWLIHSNKLLVMKVHLSVHTACIMYRSYLKDFFFNIGAT